MADRLKILFFAAECTPFAKTGVLADVVGALPKALAALGHEVRVVLPYYRSVAEAGWGKELVRQDVKFGAFVPDTGLLRSFDLRQDTLPESGIPIYLIDQKELFDRDRFYGNTDGDFGDNLDRFAFFAHACLHAAEAENFIPDVIHCHDWHTGMVPAFLRSIYQGRPIAKAGTLFTVHNLAFQGLFPDYQFGRLGLPGEWWNAEGIEFYGQVNFMKAALRHADHVSTVSPRYAEEIQGLENGSGLDGVLRARKDSLAGIINGVDYAEWSPENDIHLSTRYSADSLDLKARYKREFLKSLNLEWDADAPLLAVVSRLDSIKGLNLVEELMDYLLHMDLHFILLGTGDARLMERFQQIGATYPDRASVHLAFDTVLAHRIEAAADIFLMPSRFEPCGTGQLISLRYGTVPVVRATGGLYDTVKEYNPANGSGNGFVFHDFSSMGLFNAIQRALEVYRDRGRWRQLQRNGMSQDHSWAASARKYIDLYRKIMALRSAT